MKHLMKQVSAAVSLSALALSVFCDSAFSQSPAPADTSTNAASVSPPGPGPGARGPRGRMMRFNQNNTPGWTLMTPEERTAHRDRMRSFKTVAECESYREEHRKLMEQRAKEQGKPLPPARGNPCVTMQRRGILK
ncbi:MAG TPA: hypothetical protein VJ698_23195 [Noviherbaspirillum sp.]|uniref:hypothetical protein n=1 Tax=Noviherbaspirillum sp. TaxID=1926288 RepID=UPI002B4989EC|nr:hypothetical protein [Noviherbaspirillum sp.]HJV88394.1 hypothetical protein [Noviherbaspirillum sp.]